MRSHLLFATLALVVIGIVMVTTSTPAAPAERDGIPKTITGYGCVTAGVEAGCLMVTDKKTQTVYNVYFRGNKPRAGTAIRFTGTAHEGPTTCMQGQAVNVSNWIQLKMKCKPVS
ncbi:MAG TPA: hypothetical protein VJT71_17675 [Pyrinomonadaceae bacterium]|nr:hypothetical protein [Pyrinomonadaceae bacterium]